MIIGYDFWADNIYTSDDSTIIPDSNDNDGVAFDTCVPFSNSLENIVIQNAIYDELEILQNATEVNQDTSKSDSWTNNTLLLAKFQGDLSGGSINVDGHPIYSIQFLKRKKSETEWQLCKDILYNKEKEEYIFIDKYIESEQDYEYCIRPTARVYDETGLYTETIIGQISNPQLFYIKYDNAHLFDNESSYDLIYNFKLGDITTNIDANTITTLGGQYPFTVYGASKYKTGNVSCLLVTEESAVGLIDIGKEKELRNDIDKFLSNKKPKILKYEDGTYLLISISNNYTLTPDENLLGSYSLSFSYTEIGDANDVDTLKKYGLWSD